MIEALGKQEDLSVEMRGVGLTVEYPKLDIPFLGDQPGEFEVEVCNLATVADLVKSYFKPSCLLCFVFPQGFPTAYYLMLGQRASSGVTKTELAPALQGIQAEAAYGTSAWEAAAKAVVIKWAILQVTTDEILKDPLLGGG